MFARLQVTGRASKALQVMAVPVMCRRLAALPGGTAGLLDDPEALQSVSETFLATARRGIRADPDELDAHLLVTAQNILRLGGDPPINPLAGPVSGKIGRPGSGTANWPRTVNDGVVAAATTNGDVAHRTNRARRAAGRARCPGGGLDVQRQRQHGMSCRSHRVSHAGGIGSGQQWKAQRRCASIQRG